MRQKFLLRVGGEKGNMKNNNFISLNPDRNWSFEKINNILV